MNYKKLQIIFFIAALLLVLGLTFAIFLPYIYALIFAGILAVIFHPVFKWFMKARFFKKMPGLASVLIIIIILLIILIPLVSLGLAMVKEATHLYTTVVQGETSYTLLEKAENLVEKVIPQSRFDLTSEFEVYAKDFLSYLIQNIGFVFSNVLAVFFSFFITLFALYYLLKDGKKFKKALIILSPLSDKYDKQILKKLIVAVNSVVKGTILVAIIQGILAGIGFYIFGVPNPVLLGAVTVIAALIPAVGTAVILIPAILFLLFTQNFLGAIGLLIWGFILVGMIDNFLRPKLIEKDIKLHPLLIFLSALGGISVFGAFGFILGPLILALFFALLDIYQDEFKEYIRNAR